MRDQLLSPVLLHVTLEGADSEKLDLATRQLAAELRESGMVSDARGPEGAVPDGSKGIDPVWLGTLALAVGPVAITQLLQLLHAWVMRQEERAIEIELHNREGDLVRVKVPSTLSESEVRKYIQIVSDGLPSATQREKADGAQTGAPDRQQQV